MVVAASLSLQRMARRRRAVTIHERVRESRLSRPTMRFFIPLITSLAFLVSPAWSLLPIARTHSVPPSSRMWATRQQQQSNVSIAGAVNNIDDESSTLTELLENRRVIQLFQRGWQEPKSLLGLLKDAGIYGVIAYALVFVIFYATAGTLAEIFYHYLSGNWVDPRVLFLDDDAEGKAEILALLATFYLACQPFTPVKVGGALLITPDVMRFLRKNPALMPRSFKSAMLKSELLTLADKSTAGVGTLDTADQSRFEEILFLELPALRPMEEPARSDLLSGEWEVRWTNEKEINFTVKNGLLGLQWKRTYQSIDMPNSRLVNIIEFDGGELRVFSSIMPDPSDGTRFNFVFGECTLKWKELSVPLPPVGRGWGELLYLDEEMRIQRDIRGDLLVATKVRS